MLTGKGSLICKAEIPSPMSDREAHVRAAKEKRAAVHDEYKKRRYMVVGDLAIKAVEQAIEAAAATENKHFHVLPRTAHASRLEWARQRFPSLSKDMSELWGAYGTLGYEGEDGDRAGKVIEAMERVMNEIGRTTGLQLE
jgi:hypothetical protein